MRKNELLKIEEKYLDGKLFEDSDEKGANGYWDLAGDIADELTDDEFYYEQLQDGFYRVFQKVLVRGEKYN